MKLKLQVTSIALCIGLLSASGVAQAAYLFAIDNFTVTRDGSAFFNDTFSDGVAPPSAPNYANGTSASYSVTGTMGPESGGKLMLSSADAVPNPSGSPNYVQSALLETNTSTLSTDANKGLKSGHTFSVLGLFDLIQPGPVSESYGIRLTDKTTTSNGVDTYDLLVRRTSDNNVYVDFRHTDYSGAIPVGSTIEKIALDSTHQQIQLSLDRPDALSNMIHASFSYVDGGVVGTSQSFTSTPMIFNGVNFTRADFRVTTPVPVPAAAWLLGSGLLGLVGVARRRKAA